MESQIGFQTHPYTYTILVLETLSIVTTDLDSLLDVGTHVEKWSLESSLSKAVVIREPSKTGSLSLASNRIELIISIKHISL